MNSEVKKDEEKRLFIYVGFNYYTIIYGLHSKKSTSLIWKFN